MYDVHGYMRDSYRGPFHPGNTVSRNHTSVDYSCSRRRPILLGITLAIRRVEYGTSDEIV